MAISVGDMYSDYYKTATGATSSSTSLENKLNNGLENATDDELMSACKEFEAYFVEQMYKAMEKTVIKSDEDASSNQYTEYFGDMLTQEYSKAVTDGEGMGIAQQLYEQMQRNYNTNITSES